jgi:hypothetical protein
MPKEFTLDFADRTDAMEDVWQIAIAYAFAALARREVDPALFLDRLRDEALLTLTLAGYFDQADEHTAKQKAEAARRTLGAIFSMARDAVARLRE